MGDIFSAATQAAVGTLDIGAQLGGMWLGAKENEITRDTNRREAEKQREWEEMMSATQVQRKMADIKAAGLNPRVAMAEQGMQGAMAGTGAAANTGAPNTSYKLSLLEAVEAAKGVKEGKLLDEQAKLTREEANLTSNSAETERIKHNQMMVGFQKTYKEIEKLEQEVKWLEKENHYAAARERRERINMYWQNINKSLGILAGGTLGGLALNRMPNSAMRGAQKMVSGTD